MCEFGVLDVFDCTPTEPHGLTTLLYRRQPPSGVTAFGSLRFASLRHPRGGSFKDVALFQFTERFLHSPISSGNSVSISSFAGGSGQFVVGNFTANSSSQVFNFSSGDTYPLLNAVSLYAVPEPSTYALVVGGIATLLLIRRRRHSN